MQKTIRGCEVKFRKKCPQLWENLKPTENESVKFCEECSQNVYYAQTDKEAISYAEQGFCIAKEQYENERTTFTLGMPERRFTEKEYEEMAQRHLENNKDVALRNIRFTDMRCNECGYPIFPTWRKTCLVCNTVVPDNAP